MDVPSTVAAMSSTSVAPTAARLAPRTRLFASLSSVISWKLLLFGIFLMPPCMTPMFYPSSMPSCTIVSLAQFTPRWSGTDPEKQERTGKNGLRFLLHRFENNDCIFFQNASTKVSFEGEHEPTTRSKGCQILRFFEPVHLAKHVIKSLE